MAAPKLTPVIVPVSELRAFCERVIIKAGAKSSHAAQLAELIVAADHRGHYSHGLNRLGVSALVFSQRAFFYCISTECFALIKETQFLCCDYTCICMMHVVAIQQHAVNIDRMSLYLNLLFTYMCHVQGKGNTCRLDLKFS